MSMPGRNDPCPCGSGKKFKKCCIDTYREKTIVPNQSYQQPLTFDKLLYLVEHEMEWENELYRMQAKHFLINVDQSYGVDAIHETLQLWQDFSSIDEPMMKKLSAFSAALEYITATRVRAGVTQSDVARRYGVSSATVSKRYKEIMDFAEFSEAFAANDDEDDLVGNTPPDQLLRDIERLLAEQQFETIEEAKAFVDDYMKRHNEGLPLPRATLGNSPKDQAQRLLYEAMDESSSKKRIRLAKQALDLYPDSPDAYSILGEESENADEAKGYFLRAMEAGERDLGQEFIKQNEGYFWGLHETRPYMRAKYSYAELCWYTEEIAKAQTHFEELLRLQPGDSLGARYLLLPLYLHTNQIQAAEALLQSYDEETAFFQYGRLVLEYKKKGLSAQLKMLYRIALKANLHVPKFLLGRKKLPNGLPEYYGMGDENEAIHYVMSHALLWANSPELVKWLSEQR